MFKDFRFALRIRLRSHRWFSVAIVATLALGIGINTTVFYPGEWRSCSPQCRSPEATGVLTIDGNHLSSPNDTFRVSWEDYHEFKDSQQRFRGHRDALSRAQSVISEPGKPSAALRHGPRESGKLFPLFKTNPAAGRAIAPSDCIRSGAEPIVLLGNSVWKNRYAGMPDVVGSKVRIDGKQATVIGIMPPGFMFPRREEFWMPLVPDAEMLKRSNRSLELSRPPEARYPHLLPPRMPSLPRSPPG